MQDCIVDKVPFSSIIFGERRRIDYGNLEELADSIRTKGLIHPLAVKFTGDNQYLLLAGGRRYKALELLGETSIPVRVFTRDLNELEIRSIELEENIQRNDFTWQEKTLMVKEIDTLHRELYGSQLSGGVKSNPDATPEERGWGQADTAKLLGKDQTTISKDIKLATLVEQFPEEFGKIESKKDALKLVKKLEEDQLRAELAKRHMAAQANPENASASQVDKFNLIEKFVIGSCLDGMSAIPDGYFNFVEIDPPYSIDLQENKKGDLSGNNNLDVYNEIPESRYMMFMERVLTEAYRVMADHSFGVMWFAHEPWFEPLFQLLQKVGFKGNRMVGMWVKPNGQTMQPNIYLANCTEFFFYFRKGSPAMNKPGHSNVFVHSPVVATKKVHPTERPIELMTEILDTFALPGSKVLVPFLGSGVTLIAAHKLGMKPIGFELSQAYKEAFIVRVHKEG